MQSLHSQNFARDGGSRGSVGMGDLEQQKYIQAYSPISHLIKAAGQYECRLPETMKALRGRKKGLLNLVDTILANAFAGGGFRVEVRVRHNMATSLEEGVSLGQSIMKGLMESLGSKVQVKEIPLHQYCTFIKAELAAAMDKATFKGMRDSGPNKANEEELERFLVKRRQWAFLVSNIYWALFWPVCQVGGKWKFLPGRTTHPHFLPW